MADRFDRIAGYENVKKDLMQLRYMLHHAEEYHKVGVRIPRGIILMGEPGIGKTVLARSIADDGIKRVELRAADCLADDTKDVIRKSFGEARLSAPSVLLLDEIDKIAGTSEDFYMEGNDDVRKVLLQEMDRLTDWDDVLVVATCNDSEALGPALLRPGRFDRAIMLEKPDERTRKLILQKYFNKLKIPVSCDADRLSRVTYGYTGAMLECLVNEAGVVAMEKPEPVVSEEDILNIMNRMSFHGMSETTERKPEETRRIAVHEAGHALTALLLAPDRLFGATILSQGSSEGHVNFLPAERDIKTYEKLKTDLAVSLSGYIAEKTVYGEVGLGSEDDFRHVICLLRYAMVHAGIFGYKYLLANPLRRTEEALSDEMKRETETEMLRQINLLDRFVSDLLFKNRNLLNKIADLLVEKRALAREDLLALVSENKEREVA